MNYATDRWDGRIQEIYRRRGYLVLGRRTPARIGKIITHAISRPSGTEIKLSQPFRIVSETDIADWCACYGLGASDCTVGYFYRAMTD